MWHTRRISRDGVLKEISGISWSIFSHSQRLRHFSQAMPSSLFEKKPRFCQTRYTGPGSVGQAAIKIDMHVPRPSRFQRSNQPVLAVPGRSPRHESKTAQRLNAIRPRDKEEQANIPPMGTGCAAMMIRGVSVFFFVHRYPKDPPLWDFEELIFTVPWQAGSTFTATANIEK